MGQADCAIAIGVMEQSNWPLLWQILEPVFRAGDTYPYSPEISEAEAYQAWVAAPTATYVATDGGDIVGTYYIKPNQPTLGAHVCNCGYVVSAQARGRGIASRLCEHSQREAVRLGFRAMQYNLVVSTNQAAVYLWQKLGFEIVGTLPRAFKHSQQGFVDAFVMYKLLEA
jgi:ribosomal protein S18 acetylase RimI-like enzyme